MLRFHQPGTTVLYKRQHFTHSVYTLHFIVIVITPFSEIVNFTHCLVVVSIPACTIGWLNRTGNSKYVNVWVLALENCLKDAVVPCGLGTILPPRYPFTSPSSTLSFSFFYSFLFPFLTQFIDFLAFSIPSHSTRIVPLRFQAGCHRRWLNLALVFFGVEFILYVFLVYSAPTLTFRLRYSHICAEKGRLTPTN